MNWKAKAHLLAILSRVPAGRTIYHLLQRVGGTNRLQLDRDLNRAFELVDLCRDASGEIAGAEVMEIGTGWRPLVPFVFSLAGAKCVTTIDVNPWLTMSYALETWQALGNRLEEIAARTGAALEDVEKKYRAVDCGVAGLAPFLSQTGVRYIYPGDARETGLAANSIDLIVSSNVLEHIPLDVQTAIHSEAFRVLKSNGLSLHRFNPQDHYSTVDAEITNANFLQFSSQAWNWYGGSGLAYHNRLRSRDYREMFERTGFELKVCRERVDERSLNAIQSGALVVSEEFSRYSPTELAVDYMWIAALKPSLTNSIGGQINAGELCVGAQ